MDETSRNSRRSFPIAGPAVAVLLAVAACTLPGGIVIPFPGLSPAPTTGIVPGPSTGVGPSLPITGVRGLVLAGPTCPVERVGASPCVRAVAGAAILARNEGGSIVARATSDGAGNYFLALPPGPYTIEPQPVTGLMGTARPVTVTVPAGPPLQLDLEYDTGIR